MYNLCRIRSSSPRISSRMVFWGPSSLMVLNMDAQGNLGLQLVRVSQPSNALGYCTLLLKTGTEGVSRSAHRNTQTSYLYMIEKIGQPQNLYTKLNSEPRKTTINNHKSTNSSSRDTTINMTVVMATFYIVIYIYIYIYI